VLDQTVDDDVAGEVVRLGGETADHAMAQHRLGQGGDVLAGDVEAAVQQGPRLAADDQLLAGARTGTPLQPFGGIGDVVAMPGRVACTRSTT
jgi:hypothetical protein